MSYTPDDDKNKRMNLLKYSVQNENIGLASYTWNHVSLTPN